MSSYLFLLAIACSPLEPGIGIVMYLPVVGSNGEYPYPDDESKPFRLKTIFLNSYMCLSSLHIDIVTSYFKFCLNTETYDRACVKTGVVELSISQLTQACETAF